MMSELTVTVWEVDPAYSLVGPNAMAKPADWQDTTVEGGSPYGTTAYVASGPPVLIDPYLRQARLIDRDDDGYIGGNYLDAFVIGDILYEVSLIYRGDVLVVNGETHQMVTLYGFSAGDEHSTAISLPLDASGKLISAYSGNLTAASWSLDSEPYPIPLGDLPCFTAGSRVETPSGPREVEKLRPGDLVLTAEGRAVPLIWTTSTIFDPALAPEPEAVLPIRVPAGTLGAVADLWLSPLHRLACLDRKGREVLIPVRHLRGHGGIGGVEPRPGLVHYVHLILERHDLLLVEGVVCESFYPGPRALARLTGEERARLRRLLPELGTGRVAPARPLLDRLPMVERRLDPNLPLPLTGRALRRKALLATPV